MPVPNFITEIDGLDIHFIHVRSKHENALPLIVTHGWPGSIIEQLKIIDPLTNPTAHGGSASDAFDVVIPSMPGYGFSGKPTTTGWDPARIARAWTVLMKRLGYTQVRGAGRRLGRDRHRPDGRAGTSGTARHSHQHARRDSARHRQGRLRRRAGAGRSLGRREARVRAADFFYKKGVGYAYQMGPRPQTLYGIADSPVGLAACLLDHDARSFELIARAFDGQHEGLTRDDVLDNITLYWLTNTGDLLGPSLLGEQAPAFFGPKGVNIPVAVSVVPRRTLPGSAELGGAGVSQAHPLQQARQGRALRGLGAAEAAHGRDPRWFQIAPIVNCQRSGARSLGCAPITDGDRVAMANSVETRYPFLEPTCNGGSSDGDFVAWRSSSSE